MTRAVRDGVFFTAPGELPRGRHDLGRDAVLAAQRERLMIAATELMAADGYRGAGVREIAARARVSRAAFYESFSDKDACLFAAYDRFVEVLLARIGRAYDASGSWHDTVRAIIHAYLDTLARDPVVARAFQVEMESLGQVARTRRREALTGVAMLLKAQRDRAFPGSGVPDSAYVGAVYAVRQLASDVLDAHAQPDFGPLAEEASTWVAEMLAPGS